MSNFYNNTGKTKYIVCHNADNIWHYAQIENNHQITSGQPYMEIYDSEQEVFALYGDKLQTNSEQEGEISWQ